VFLFFISMLFCCPLLLFHYLLYLLYN